MSYAFDVQNMRAVVPNGPTPWLYDDRLRMGGIKLYADGALGSRGAWLKQPYADKPDTRGLQFLTDAELLATGRTKPRAHGLQVASTLSAMPPTPRSSPPTSNCSQRYGKDRRWRIEHFQIVDPADIPRLAPAGIIASMQPTHQTSDRLMAEKRLGPDRLAGAYAWQIGRSSRAPGSRSVRIIPVESPNPFPGLSAAVSRQDMNGQPPGGWIPEERVSLRAGAVAASPATQLMPGFAEQKFGALEPGKWADFIIVDRDVDRGRSLRHWLEPRCWRPGSPGRRCGSGRLAAAAERGK